MLQSHGCDLIVTAPDEWLVLSQTALGRASPFPRPVSPRIQQCSVFLLQSQNFVYSQSLGAIFTYLCRVQHSIENVCPPGCPDHDQLHLHVQLLRRLRPHRRRPCAGRASRPLWRGTRARHHRMAEQDPVQDCKPQKDGASWKEEKQRPFLLTSASSPCDWSPCCLRL